jgi:adenylosuccinate synthase
VRNTIVVLTGAIAAGKSTIAKALTQKGFYALHTRQAIVDEAKARSHPLGLSRRELQDYGDKLDEMTDYAWLANRAMKAMMGHNVSLVIDSVRKPRQIERMRNWSDVRVFQVHVTADYSARMQRYAVRGDQVPIEEAERHPTERGVWECEWQADMVLDNTLLDTASAVRLILAGLGQRPPVGCVDALVGGQYGSEGKGHVVSYIAPEYDVMVRVGGPNAGHTVLHPETNEKVSFYHLPSGALHMDGYLVLGPGANIRIPVLQKELEVSGIDPARVVIDPQANVITDGDIEGEGGLVAGIGSTGQGVGHATARKILDRSGRGVHGLADGFANGQTLRGLGCRIEPTRDVLERHMRAGSCILLEGTQGTGLSLHHGPYPYVTSRDTTVTGAAAEAGIAPSLIDRVYMVCRTNPIRVQSPDGGTSGPMSMETTWEEISKRASLPAETLRQKEMTTTTKRQRRVAEFDYEQLYQAALLNRPTDIALTFVDYISVVNQDARRYEQLTRETHDMIENIERVAGVRVSLITTRFHRRSIIDRRVK